MISRLIMIAGLGLGLSLPAFLDTTGAWHLSFINETGRTSHKYLPETMTGGVALLDYDGDGRLDVFLVNGAGLHDPMQRDSRPDKLDPKFWNRLYHNNGNGTFSDVTSKSGLRGSGYGMGVAVADYDNDGRPDLYVTSVGGNRLYHNEGTGVFADVTEQAGVAGGGWSTGAAFVDYDRDGLLDLVVARYLDWDWSMDVWCGARTVGLRAYCEPDLFKPVTHLLFHNEGNGHFRNVSSETGFDKLPGKGLGVAINDYDRDGWPDIFIANDGVAQQLFHNQQGHGFDEVALAAGVAYDEDGRAFAGMGVDFADYDNNGWPDIIVSTLANQRYALFQNRKGSFQYSSGFSGIGSATRKHSGWGVKFIDYDNDGWKDIFVGQGHVMDNIQSTQPDLSYLEPSLLLLNSVAKFVAVPTFDRPRAARGVAFGDLNGDGFQDVVMNCNGAPAVLLMNQGGVNHWLIVNTIGTVSNREGIGAQLHLVTRNGLDQYAVVSTASSYLSASDKRVYFGLGHDTDARSLQITWPSGQVQRVENITGDRILNVREPGPDHR